MSACDYISMGYGCLQSTKLSHSLKKQLLAVVNLPWVLGTYKDSILTDAIEGQYLAVSIAIYYL